MMGRSKHFSPVDIEMTLPEKQEELVYLPVGRQQVPQVFGLSLKVGLHQWFLRERTRRQGEGSRTLPSLVKKVAWKKPPADQK